MNTTGMRRAAPLVFVALAVAVLFMLFPEREDALDWTGREEITILLTEHGFEPESVFITRGTNVVFVSERGNEFWPASDLHPFHTIYSAFDAKRPLSPDESWSFVFEKDGHWSFHDHIDALATGAIIVIPPGAVADERYDVIPECDQESLDGRRACWKLRIKYTLEKKDLAAAFDEIQRVYEDQADFREDCHLYAHDLGIVAYQRYGDDIPFTPKIATCGQGFYHGYMEAFLSWHEGDVVAASEFCEHARERLGTVFPLSGPQCHHGIGHGQMEYLLATRLDLLRDLPQLVGIGITDCGKLPDDDAQFRCASGIYAVMKDWVNIQDLFHVYPEFFSLADPYALCRYVSEDWAKRACAWELSKEVYLLAEKDPDIAFPAEISAGQAWEPKYLDLMIRSTAFLIGEVGITLSDEELAASCRSIREQQFKIWCIQGIEQGLLFNGHPGGNEVERSVRFCRSDVLSDAEREGCEEVLVSYMQGAYGTTGQKSACEALRALDLSSAGCET
ncbi:hypothetical protein COU18_02430 [Candidatus Kaiserbacteria bacterium CG10_big_fil_rev_8_21_14_0_10_51_14]|uniref:EfeO-type cupredoxin-like domain-containing protein n=1 Tax=Candidatus Kaiserbacteria bacterium CG10_big_fil_rev_8_21_14_0_10_51_14 TaxID=1974610 RepID=A0A2H0UBN0_9BACT|nr:MAG: hypothetical protein COU18_02430 [Candidatus Kaiserbacteria bacterium CG10_big_fil_rev_8_21_14_0_10_51_14]